METFDEVLGHLLARVNSESVDTKKLLQSYSAEKNKPENAAHLSSAAFTKPMLENTLETLRSYTAEFFPHATALIRSKMVTRTKLLVAEDICEVLFSITPVQCRTCKTTYIATSAENTDANITCLLCGRRSHKDCLKEYTIDHSAGVVFLCDPCLAAAETNLVLQTVNSQQTHADQNTPQEVHTPIPPTDGDTGHSSTEQQNNSQQLITTPPGIQTSQPPDDICPLYKENSCPHGLTGKRPIDGQPCPYKHPKKCHYFTGKYGNNGCRYSARRCPFYHPPLCENGFNLKICLNKQCTKTHITGTKRQLTNPAEHPRNAQRNNGRDPRSETPRNVQHYQPQPDDFPQLQSSHASNALSYHPANAPSRQTPPLNVWTPQEAKPIQESHDSSEKSF